QSAAMSRSFQPNGRFLRFPMRADDAQSTLMKSKDFDPASRRDFLLVLDDGDDVIAALTAFARASGIDGAAFHGIGAFRRAAVAYWHPATKEYEEIAVSQPV